jgi:hypothetical protein
MNDDQRLQLQGMINEHNVIDKTEMIRKIKHSSILRKEVNEMIELKQLYKTNMDTSEFRNTAMEKCNFLFKYYTDIFNKLRNDELNVDMLFDFLDVLEKIEKGSLNQHEASFQIGSILKNMYIDSAVKHAENLEKKEQENKSSKQDINNTPKKESKDISWKHFKKKLKLTN